MFVTPARLVRSLGHWHVDTQEVARRNARVASTALAERRLERVEVETFLSSLEARSVAETTLEVRVRGA